MKDMLGREITPGCFIAYGLIVGRSANLAIYHVREVLGDKIKAHKLDESYGYGSNKVVVDGIETPSKYVVFEYEDGRGYSRLMTREERERVDNKTTTLKMGERALVIDEHTVKTLKDMVWRTLY